MTCAYCRGGRVFDNAVDGPVACRMCLGTDGEPYEGDLGHDARPRELRRIAELLDTLADQRAALRDADPKGTV